MNKLIVEVKKWILEYLEDDETVKYNCEDDYLAYLMGKDIRRRHWVKDIEVNLNGVTAGI